MAVYWGWVVCFSGLLVFVVAVGINFSFCEMMIPIGKESNISVSMLALAGAIPISIPMLAATTTPWIDRRFGTRPVIFVGAALSSLSMLWMGVGTNLVLTLSTYGVINGIGLLLIINPPVFLLGQYFPYAHPRHVLATSLNACGFPMATMTFNPLTYALIEALGWRMCYIVYAAVILVVGSIAAFTLRPCRPEELAHEMTRSTGSSSSEQSLDDSADSRELKNEELVHGSASLDSGCFIPMYTKIMFGSLWLSASILKAIGYCIPIATLVKQMDVLGVPQSKSSLVMTVIGIFEIITRVCTSCYGDRIKGKNLYFYVVSALILSVENALGSLAVTYTHLLIFAIAQGISEGPLMASMYSTCAEVLGGQHVPMLFSLFRTGLGIGQLVGPTIAGAIFDVTGSFRIVYYVTALAYAVASLAYFLIIYLNRKRPKYFFPTAKEVSSRNATNIIPEGTSSLAEERLDSCLEEAAFYDRKSNYSTIASTSSAILLTGS